MFRHVPFGLLLAAACGPSSAGTSATSATTSSDTTSAPGATSTSTSVGPGATSDPGGDSSTAESTSTSTTGASTSVTSSSGGGSTTSPSTTESTSNSDGSTTDTTVTTDTTTTEPSECVHAWKADCQQPLADCEALKCGDLYSEWAADGTLRSDCDLDDCPCPSGQTCFQPQWWGGCTPTNLICSDGDDDGLCNGCGGSEDCGGAYCVPDEIAPNPACPTAQDEQSCLAAGCGAFTLGRSLELNGDTCVCGDLLPFCLWFDEEVTSAPIPTVYYHGLFGPVLVPTQWSKPPFSWTSCNEGVNPPQACSCIEQCSL